MVWFRNLLMLSGAATIAALTPVDAANGAGAASARCAVERELAMKQRLYGVVESCFPIKALITTSALELPTEILTKIYAPGAVAWLPKSRALIVRSPTIGKHRGFVLCNARRHVISEIPGKGKYLKHGVTKVSETSLQYQWQLERRQWLRGRTSLNVDLFVSFIAPVKYQQAVKAGVCVVRSDLMSRHVVGWRS